MIGFYNYSVLVTYLGVALSVIGMSFACNGRYEYAILCLALAGACDTFDGKIARSMKNRTKEMEIFGVQIDSLCDVVCFGAFPVILAYSLGMRGPVGIVILALYGVCGVIRLGYFNVMETKRQQETSENRQYYSGLPITSIAVILPLIYMISTIMKKHFNLLLHCGMLATAMLFVVNFKMKKPKNSTLVVLVAIVAAALLRIFHFI